MSRKLITLSVAFLLAIVIVIAGCAEHQARVTEPVISNERLSVVDGPLKVGRYRHYVWIIKDSETGKEFIIVTESDGTAICPISSQRGELDFKD